MDSPRRSSSTTVDRDAGSARPATGRKREPGSSGAGAAHPGPAPLDASSSDPQDPRRGGRTETPIGLPAVLADLLDRAYRFDFFQAIWLLEQHLTPGRGGDLFRPASRHHEGPRIRITPSPSTAFPAADVRRVTLLADDASAPTAEVEVTFMGLYGINAPLPSYFVERIVRTPDDGAALRSFLDVLNHRIYSLFYRAWKRVRPLRSVPARSTALGDAAVERHLNVFRSLSGLGIHGTIAHRSSHRPGGGRRASGALPAAHPAHPHWTALAGRLSGHVRNREGLEVLLQNTLGVPARVQENVGRWTTLRRRPTTGRNSRRPLRLGRQSVVGGRLFDVAGKFRIVLGPLDLDAYRSLRPGGEAARLLQSVVSLYLIEPLDYDVDLRLDPAELSPAALGDDRSRVGSTARLGRPPRETVSEIVAYPSRL